MFRALAVLARLKRVRGTWFDPFGYSAERRGERAAIADYIADVDRLLQGLTADRYELACSIASLPLDARGFGPVKAAAEAAVAHRRAALWARWANISA